MKLLKLTYIYLILIFFISVKTHADENQEETKEYVVTATRLSTPREELGSSVTVITNEEIEKRGDNSVIEILRSIEGIDVVKSGGKGGNSAIFIRGANSEHTLVLIDGVEANNPATTNRSFNFSDLSLDNVERIEIIRGPQSTLYGSDALGGVINIITKKGEGSRTGGLIVEAGSYRTYNERANISGGDELVNYSVGLSREDSDSFSAASTKYGNFEKDSYQNSSFSGRVGLTPSDQLSFDLITRYTDSRSDIDAYGGLGGDDPNRIVDNQETFLRGQALTSFFDGRLTQTFGIGFSDHDLDDNDDPDQFRPLDKLRSNYSGKLIKADVQNNIIIDKRNTLVFGVETEQEKADTTYFSQSAFGDFESNLTGQDARTNGYYLQDQISISENFFSTFGIRIDDHSQFGSELTWRIAPSYLIEQTATRLKGTYGTGFKAPSLLQLYSQYGNRDLDPEESEGWDIGFEQELYERFFSFGTVYFHNSFDNLISFDPNTFFFENITEATTSGFESFVAISPLDSAKVTFTHTYTDTEDKITGQALLRRPKNKFAIGLNMTPISRLNIETNYRLVGSRFDNDFSTFPATRVKLGGYGLLDLSIRYLLDQEVTLLLRAENIFDKEYEEVLGFGTSGSTVYAGIQLSL